MTRQEAEALIKKHGSIRKAAAACTIGRNTIRRAMAARTRANAVEAKRTGKTLADFRQTYDKSTIVPGKVKAALASLGAGGWDYEVQFAKLAGVNLADLGMFRDKFAAHVVDLRDHRRAWAGTAATAKQMREMI